MRTLLLTLITCLALSAHGQVHKDSLFSFSPVQPNFGIVILDTHAEMVIAYDCFKPAIQINFIKGKPVANKPYVVFIRNHSLIIFKHGKKVGAFKYYDKPYQLTNLKLN